MPRKKAAAKTRVPKLNSKKKQPSNTQAIREDLIFTCVLGALKKWCQPSAPVRLVIKKMPDGVLGTCRFVKDKGLFLVYLNSDMSPPQATDVLVHEWAHALAWNYLHDKCAVAHSAEQAQMQCEWLSHDEAWGCAYSKTYRAYLDGARIASKVQHCKSEEERTKMLAEMIFHATRKRGLLL